MKMKRNELMLFTLLSLISVGAVTVAVGASNGLLDKELTSHVEAGPGMTCKLDWTKTEKIENGLSLSKNGAVELKYGSSVTQDAESHAILYGDSIETNYISTSGRPYSNGVGGVANGMGSITFDFDDTVADLRVEVWNTLGSKPNGKLKYTISKSGTTRLKTSSTIDGRPNSFRIYRQEREGADPTVPLKIRSIKVACSTVEEPIVTTSVNVNDFESLRKEMSGNDKYESKIITLTNDIVFNVSNPDATGLVPEIMVHDKDIVLELNGHTMSFAQNVTKISCVPAFIGLKESAHLLIRDNTFSKLDQRGKGSIQAHIADNTVYGITIGEEGIADEFQPTCTIESGTFIGAPTAIQVKTGELTIENGYFDVAQIVREQAPTMAKYIINAIDRFFDNGTAKIEIQNGTYGYNYSLPVENNGGRYWTADTNNVFFDNNDGTYTIVSKTSLNKEFQKKLNSTSFYKMSEDILFKISSQALDFDIKVFIDNPNLTLDLNGHKIGFTPLKKDQKPGVSILFDIVHNSNVTIIDSSKNKTGSIDVSSGPNFVANAMGFRLSDTAKLTINGGHYTGAPQVAQVNGGLLEINDGEFYLTDKAKANSPTQAMYIVNCLDASSTSNIANIIINGGTFGYDYSKAVESNKKPYMANGKTSIDNEDGSWTILDKQEVLKMHMKDGTVKETSNMHLQHLLNSTNKFTLEGDIEFASHSKSTSRYLEPLIFISNPELEVDLAGHAIKFADALDPNTIMKGVICFFQICDNSNVKFNDSSIEKAGIVDTNIAIENHQGAYGFNILGENAKLTILDGSYTGGPTGVQVQKGLLEIYGGNFDLDAGCKAAAPGFVKYIVNCIDASFKDKIANIKIYGGTFCFDPSLKPESPEGSTYVAEGYESVKNEDNTYTIHLIETKKPEIAK